MTITTHATQTSIRSLYIEDVDGAVLTCEPAINPADELQESGSEGNIIVSLDRHSTGMTAELTPAQARDLYRHLGMLISILGDNAGQ